MSNEEIRNKVLEELKGEFGNLSRYEKRYGEKAIDLALKLKEAEQEKEQEAINKIFIEEGISVSIEIQTNDELVK